MTQRLRPPTRLARTARAGSWMALLAATTLGDGAGTVHAEVKANGLAATGRYRLIVQTYDNLGVSFPRARQKPIGSTQRAVTAEELRQGVHVNLVELGQESPRDPVVVAWVEAGEPDLEFDARRARPAPGAAYGLVKRDVAQRDVRISLTRRMNGKLAA